MPGDRAIVIADRIGNAHPTMTATSIISLTSSSTAHETNSGSYRIAYHRSGSPGSSTGTAFGSLPVGQHLQHTVTISNTGTGPLILNGTPAITVMGSVATDFQITKPVTTTLTGGVSVTFRVTSTDRGECAHGHHQYLEQRPRP